LTEAIPDSPAAAARLLTAHGYVPDEELGVAVYLALKLGRPLFLEGEAGVGKTELAKVLAQALKRELIRLPCYEGLDTATAVYEWDHLRQLLEIRLAEASGAHERESLTRSVFAPHFLIERPLLRALRPHPGGPPVLLIDELDRADEPFEALLLELLGEFQVTIPELGTIRAAEPPIVVITSNRTRDIHDALKRRCLYQWLDYPSAARELEILRQKEPGLDGRLQAEVVAFVQRLRREDLFKAPGIAETLDWARALAALNVHELGAEWIELTLGALLKYQDDVTRVRDAGVATLLSAARTGS